MKSHKYWSLGALFCMLGCIYSGIKKSMTAHKYFAYSSLLCTRRSRPGEPAEHLLDAHVHDLSAAA